MLQTYNVLDPLFWDKNNLDPNANYVGPGKYAAIFPQAIAGISIKASAAVHDDRWLDAKLLSRAEEKWMAYFQSNEELWENIYSELKAGLMLEWKAWASATTVYSGVSNVVAAAIFADEDGAL